MSARTMGSRNDTAWSIASKPLQAFNLLVSIVTSLWFASTLHRLPERVPVHWGPSGPDRFGSPHELWLFAGVLAFDTVMMWITLALVAPQRVDVGRVAAGDRARVEGAAREQKVAVLRMLEWLFVGLNVCFAGFWIVATEAARTVDVSLVHRGGVFLLGGIASAMVVPVVAFLPRALRARRALRAVPGAETSRDSDWIGGVIYYAPGDPRLLVPKRFGIGWTFNFARPMAWALLACFLAVPVGLAILGIAIA